MPKRAVAPGGISGVSWTINRPLEYTTRIGERLVANLRALMERHPLVGEVHGKGLFCGAELVADRKTKEPLEEKRV